LSVLPAAVETIQRWLPAPSAVACVTVKSTLLPSGESSGAERALKCRKSSFVGKCGAVADEAVAGGPDCALRSDAPRAIETKGRASRNRSMAAAYNGEGGWRGIRISKSARFALASQQVRRLAGSWLSKKERPSLQAASPGLISFYCACGGAAGRGGCCGGAGGFGFWPSGRLLGAIIACRIVPSMRGMNSTTPESPMS
jgi:hypothetical protein